MSMKKEEVSKVMKHLSRKAQAKRFKDNTKTGRSREMRRVARSLWDDPERRQKWYEARWGSKIK